MARNSARRSPAARFPDPRILLLDDPLRNVEPNCAMRCVSNCLHCSRTQINRLYVTQDYKERMALGDRIAVLLDGDFVQVASPTEVYLQPATLASPACSAIRP